MPECAPHRSRIDTTTEKQLTLDIMMPFYGRFDHFKVAVQSVLSQSDPNWRLVVVDDVYPDLEPGRWVRSIDDERITYIRNETNLRPSKNYQKCVGLMTSEFAVLMGCDDIMSSNYVAQIKAIVTAHPNTSIVQPGVAVVDEDGRPSHPLADRVKRIYRPSGAGAREYSGEKLATSLLRADWTYFPSLCWRVAELKHRTFREDLDVVQDLAMLLEITKAGGSLTLDDTLCFYYRRHANSLSAVTGPDGSKFVQENALFAQSNHDFQRMGWTRAARAARIHLTSRLNALSELPAALRASDPTGRRTLARHVFGR